MKRKAVAALAFLLSSICAACAGEASSAGDASLAAQNLLVISIDTLRADRLGCYGYERDTSPAIDRFAARAVRFERAIAESPWTIPSHVTLFTGLHPRSHGVQTPEQRLSDDLPTLAEILSEAGFFTFAITGGGWLSEEWGFDRGFEFFDASERGFAHVLERARDFVRFRRERGRFFGFLHTFDVHCPYDAPARLAQRFASPGAEPFDTRGRCGNPDFNARARTPGEDLHLSDLYDAGIRWVDEALDPFLAFLESEGVLDDTLVVLTSDHGEELGEHGQIGHERSLHAELLRIPLIVHAPGVAPGTRATPVGLGDVLPTAFELLGLAAPPADGRSLVAALQDARAPGREAVISELGWQRALLSWSDGIEHLILTEDGEPALFRWPSDPGEATDLAVGEPERVLELEARLRTVVETYATGPSPEVVLPVGPARAEELRGLGYVGPQDE